MMAQFWDIDFRIAGESRVWTLSILRPGDERAAWRTAQESARDAKVATGYEWKLLRDTLRPAPEPKFTFYGDDPLLRRR